MLRKLTSRVLSFLVDPAPEMYTRYFLMFSLVITLSSSAAKAQQLVECEVNNCICGTGEGLSFRDQYILHGVLWGPACFNLVDEQDPSKGTQYFSCGPICDQLCHGDPRYLPFASQGI